MNKAQLKHLALELRQEIDLDPFEIFHPYRLTELYGIDVYQLCDLECSPEAMAHFQVTRSEVFSGALVPVGTGAVIIENDVHDPFRRRSTAAHEMAHVVLDHPFTATMVNERGCRTAEPEHEAEAAELGGELLLSFEAAKRLAWSKLSDEDAASQYGVSVEIARWRLNATGARKIAARARASQQRRGA